MTVSTAAQWILLAGYAALLLASLGVGWRRERLRPLAFTVGFLAFTHTAFYVAFLLLPGWMDGRQLFNFSIVIRYQVLFTALLLLISVVAWERRWQ